jgi:hypothetical protein
MLEISFKMVLLDFALLRRLILTPIGSFSLSESPRLSEISGLVRLARFLCGVTCTPLSTKLFLKSCVFLVHKLNALIVIDNSHLGTIQTVAHPEAHLPASQEEAPMLKTCWATQRPCNSEADFRNTLDQGSTASAKGIATQWDCPQCL